MSFWQNHFFRFYSLFTSIIAHISTLGTIIISMMHCICCLVLFNQYNFTANLCFIDQMINGLNSVFMGKLARCGASYQNKNNKSFSYDAHQKLFGIKCR